MDESSFADANFRIPALGTSVAERQRAGALRDAGAMAWALADAKRLGLRQPLPLLIKPYCLRNVELTSCHCGILLR
jgi:hypothetical protein